MMLSRLAVWLLRWLEPACWFKNPAWAPLPTPAVTPVEPDPASGSGGDQTDCGFAHYLGFPRCLP